MISKRVNGVNLYTYMDVNPTGYVDDTGNAPRESAYSYFRTNVHGGKIMKLIICFLIILFLNFCGSGPAEDRAKTNCRNAILFSLAGIDAINQLPEETIHKSGVNKNSMFFINYSIYEFACYQPIHDSLIERYYRGYVDGKE